ncbi:four helix bundle protein [Halarcobacter anaerophilus]|uniref:Four helix bundle protein n=2 Tax=Halarcobacter anaerophilus TaxID=877500 RepID=A0A4Q0Y325_9BACT|nr:four helix bundle protein [Halarcobacter anaerophilus]QDF28999.1 four helix bundle protein [Halarcobacter anaerophilus]RXJ63634.1 four helix bundle protein [Halarcobacter anaerophilus]
MGIHSEAILNRKYMEMIKLLNIYLNHFPKFEKYALSNNIRNTAYEVYDLITECQKRYFKKTSLTSLDVTHQKLRMQIYLANELGYFAFKDGRKDTKVNPQKRFLAITKVIDEIGKIIGAWINKLKDKGNFK